MLMVSGQMENLFDGPSKLSQQRAMNDTEVLVPPGMAVVRPGPAPSLLHFGADVLAPIFWR